MKKPRSRGFTLIELLVVLVIIMVLAGMLMVGVQAAQEQARKVKVRTLISGLMLGLDHYHTEFRRYPPGGYDGNKNGNLTDPGDDRGSGTDPSTWMDQENPGIEKLQLRGVCWLLQRKDKDGKVIGTSGPYFNPNDVEIKFGGISDAWGEALCYLADGSSPTYNATTGIPNPGRVYGNKPVIWSLGPDRVHDWDSKNERKRNDNIDGDGNGKVDDFDELYDDICSWNMN